MRQWSLLLKEEGFHLVQETLQVTQGVISVLRRGLVLIGVAVQGVSHLVPAGGWTKPFDDLGTLGFLTTLNNCMRIAPGARRSLEQTSRLAAPAI